MSAESFFREMYAAIWQSRDIGQFDRYYARDFEETISVSDENKNPIELHMKYADLVSQAKWQKENYRDTTFEILKLVACGTEYISVHFHSTSIEKQTGEKRYRSVCGIWRLNREHKIDRVWAVVTPYYS